MMPVTQAPEPMLSPDVGARKTLATGNAFAVASMLAWSAGFPAAEILLDTWTPTALITARLGLAVLMLMPLWILLDGPRAVLTARWGRGLLIGGLAFGMGAWLLVVAQSLTDAVTVAIIASACPVAAVIVEMIWQGRRLSRGFLLGLVATLAGGIIATGGGSVALGLGALAAIISCFLFSWGSLLTTRDFPLLTPLGRATVTFAGGFVAMAAVTLASETLGWSVVPTASMDMDQMGLLAIYAFAGMALSQVLFLAAVGKMGVALTSFHINIAPFYVMLIMVALGGTWSWQAAAGAFVVALGVLAAQRG